MQAGERVTRSIERQLRGINLTNAQAERIRRSVGVAAATATDPRPMCEVPIPPPPRVDPDAFRGRRF